MVRSFVNTVKERSLGEVITVKADGMNVTPSDHFINICHQELIALMGPVDASINLEQTPSVIMMVGLQGSGKKQLQLVIGQ